MSKEKKTNVMRILDKAKIPYIARSYEYKESNLSGTHAATALGYDPAIVFKTIVTKGDRTGLYFLLAILKGTRFKGSRPN